MLARLPDWRNRLDEYLASCLNRKYRPGRFDCAMFAAGAVFSLTGYDPAEQFRGRYRTIRAGQELAGGSHVAYAEALFPARPSILDARVGDLAVLGDALGVVVGDTIRACHPVEGLVVVPLVKSDRVLAV